MKYDTEQAISYLQNVRDLINESYSHRAQEKLNSPEFSELCRDLVQSLSESRGSSLDFGMEIDPDVFQPYSDKNEIGKIAFNYCIAVGVIAASPNLPEQQKALAYASTFLSDKNSFTALDGMMYGYEAKVRANAIKNSRYDPCPELNELSQAVEGFALLSRGDLFRIAPDRFLASERSHMADFLERIEKTRSFSDLWGANSDIIKRRYLDLAQGIGRKDDHLNKIFRLVNDGSPTVSISDCISATKDVAYALLYPGHISIEAFKGALDALDEHQDYFKIAFQDEVIIQTKKHPLIYSLLDFGREERFTFQKCLSELNKRIQGKVADPNVLLSSILTGKSISSALTDKDRYRGDPRWLERSLLESAEDISMLHVPHSTLSIVLDGLLERLGDDAVKQFWKSCEEIRGFPVREWSRLKEVTDDQGPSL